MPGSSGVTVVTTLVCFISFAREAAGALSARHSLRPLFSDGGKLKQNSGACREIAESFPELGQRHWVCARERKRRGNPFSGLLCAMDCSRNLSSGSPEAGPGG